jgi:hypothetical protein
VGIGVDALKVLSVGGDDGEQGSTMPRITYANVVATLALVLAMGATSWAEPVRQAAARLITGKQIKDGSVAKRDLARGVRSKLARTGARGPTGPTGAQGSQGPQGVQGPAGSDTTFSGVAAGGALAGSYPNPVLAADAVGPLQIDNGSLDLEDITRLEVQATLDFASIPDGECATQSIPLPVGLDDPLAVVNAPPNFYTASPGLLFNSHIGINDGDDIQLRACNVTNLAIDPPSGNWRAAVFEG